MTMVGIGDRPRTEPVGGPEAMIAVADDIKLDFTHDDELVDQDKRDTEYVTEFPEKERRRIVRKVDMRLVPVLTLLYCVFDNLNPRKTRIGAPLAHLSYSVLVPGSGKHW